MRKAHYGFTFVEIMVVVGIIALLTAIALPNLLTHKKLADEASAKATLKTIAVALENYYAIHTRYPPDTDTLIIASPAYLNKDYFVSTHYRYTFTAVLTDYSYSVTATPILVGQGFRTYTITTGAVFTES